jgi:hypothetical protein
MKWPNDLKYFEYHTKKGWSRKMFISNATKQTRDMIRWRISTMWITIISINSINLHYHLAYKGQYERSIRQEDINDTLLELLDSAKTTDKKWNALCSTCLVNISPWKTFLLQTPTFAMAKHILNMVAWLIKCTQIGNCKIFNIGSNNVIYMFHFLMR